MDILADTGVGQFPPRRRKGGMDQAQTLTPAWGAAAAGRDLCVFLYFPVFSFLFSADLKH
jgi:hypothetical protein